MLLKPQDAVVVLKLALRREAEWTYKELGRSLFLSAAEVHNAAKRALHARLLLRVDRRAPTPSRLNLLEFLVHGAKYAFPPDRGGLTRGYPTAHAAPQLRALFAPATEPPPVWPNSDGPARGQAFSPLHRSAVKAAQEDAVLYRALAAVDLLRGGGAREQKIGARILAEMLGAAKEP